MSWVKIVWFFLKGGDEAIMKVILGSIKRMSKHGGFSNRIYSLDMNLEVCSI